jgi:hypothetical protein
MPNFQKTLKVLAAAAIAFADAPAKAAVIAPERLPTANALPWSPGIPGGIPSVTTKCSTAACVTLETGSFGNGTTDATSAINNAITSCPVGQYVFLPAGNYRTTGTIGMKSGVVLRGAGPASTSIRLDNAPTLEAIRVGNFGGWGNGLAVTSGATKGSTSITVAATTGLAVGDMILIDEIDAASPEPTVDTGGCTWYKRNSGGVRSLGQTMEITSISGNTLGLSSPLYATYEASRQPQVAEYNNPTRNVGIEDLQVTRLSANGGQGWLIHVQWASSCWVRNVEAYRVSGRAIAFEGCYRGVVRDSYVHEAWDYASGANAYGIVLNSQTSDSLVENNISRQFNFPVLFENSGGGNVVGYNYVDEGIISDPGWQMPGIGSHCSFPYMELVEGNWTPNMGTDNVHGGAGSLTYFRNYSRSQNSSNVTTGNRTAVSVMANALNFNVVGNVLGMTGLPGNAAYEVASSAQCGASYVMFRFGGDLNGFCPQNPDPRPRATVYRHGNFDHVNNNVLWDPGNPDHALPESLYLSGQPSWWGGRTWPFVDPERASQRVGSLPALDRYNGVTPTPADTMPPDRPRNLHRR